MDPPEHLFVVCRLVVLFYHVFDSAVAASFERRSVGLHISRCPGVRQAARRGAGHTDWTLPSAFAARCANSDWAELNWTEPD
ncbi:hypothetical protein BDP81DRAFT_10441 [Colletotrichum phormii]|uniref:Secreted protein n=1 Tax=Colletotrichum phormii TaxID=359342 RepID=A0AAJ0A771_9PEZI|nr:uncharacterized protein BDP81DRAFT_10441 [Colletotrichum phormii]KAK1655810.1 hypothetical protein BDP81DRAFT_10441 [Colletotrichum phormii]